MMTIAAPKLSEPRPLGPARQTIDGFGIDHRDDANQNTCRCDQRNHWHLSLAIAPLLGQELTASSDRNLAEQTGTRPTSACCSVNPLGGIESVSLVATALDPFRDRVTSRVVT